MVFILILVFLVFFQLTFCFFLVTHIGLSWLLVSFLAHTLVIPLTQHIMLERQKLLRVSCHYSVIITLVSVC